MASDTTGGFRAIILFDGVCRLCNRFARFVLKYDRHSRFRFASLQSHFARALLNKHDIIPGELRSVYVVVDNGLHSQRVLSQSSAALYALHELGGVWRLAGAIAGTLPAWLRNFAYGLGARHRYRIFGRYDVCPLPAPFSRDAFIDF
jgi:predicted DCC family thiol-disulfide oxidoreductase YuxK